MPPPQNNKNEQEWEKDCKLLLSAWLSLATAQISSEKEIDYTPIFRFIESELTEAREEGYEVGYRDGCRDYVDKINDPTIHTDNLGSGQNSIVPEASSIIQLARKEERERMAAWMKEHKYDFGCYDEGCPFYNDLAAEAFIKYLNTNEE